MAQDIVPISLKDFFEKIPPGRPVRVLAPAELTTRDDFRGHHLDLPTLELYCEVCDGVRSFSAQESVAIDVMALDRWFVTCVCRNCEVAEKTYACWSDRIADADPNDRQLFKFGEYPPFGAHTPSKIISLLGSEKDNYLKGRRAESQGMGIAAYAYYRRSVENKKNDILDEITRASERLGAPADMLADLKAARQETQFKTAIEAIKHGIPESLKVNGQNPLTLLHSALSAGLHDHTDEECLELAADIRIVLTEMVERMTTAMKDEAELKASVSRLMKRSASKPPGKT